MLKVILVLFLLVISFFCGAFVAVVGSDSLGRKYVDEVLIKLLLIVVTISEDVEYIKSTKYHIMRECDYDLNEIKAQKNIDEFEFSKWKNRVIRTIITRHPYPKDLQFHDYNSALVFLTEYFESLSETSKEKNQSVNKLI
tara:strand:+ start:323 stop:742 length:420 start_codon:yes stop_codon:yes gene_type:complete